MTLKIYVSIFFSCEDAFIDLGNTSLVHDVSMVSCFVYMLRFLH